MRMSKTWSRLLLLVLLLLLLLFLILLQILFFLLLGNFCTRCTEVYKLDSKGVVQRGVCNPGEV